MTRIVRFFIALGVLILMGVLAGAYYQQFFVQGNPCPLCILQRLGMIAVGTTALLNLRFGIQLKYYAFTILAAFIGAAVSILQILLNICPTAPLFGTPVLGLNLYTWCFLIFGASVLGTTALIALYQPKQSETLSMNWWEKLSALTLILLTVANCFTTFQECGIGIKCQGKKASPQTAFLESR